MSHDLGLLGRAILRREANRARQRAAKLRTLHNIGTIIVSSEDVDQVLTRVVEAAVFISNAEEGALLLLDEGTDELYLRAQKGLGEKYANGYRLRVEDSIAGDVVQSGLSQRLISKSRDLKVVTGYMVNAIVYVPVCGKNGAIGVLSVDNQTADASFSEDDEEFLFILAGYTALALENARRIRELERRPEVDARKDDGQPSMPVHDSALECVRIVLNPDHSHSPFQMPFSDALLDVVNPYLEAMTNIQHCVDELEGKPPSQVRVAAIGHEPPVVAAVEGIRKAAAVISRTFTPQRRYLQALTSRLLLAEKEVVAEKASLDVLDARARVDGDTDGAGWSIAEIADRVAHLQQLQHDRESLNQELRQLKVGLACDLIASIAPGLTCAETIQYVMRLLPALDLVLASPLELAMPQQRDGPLAEDGQTVFLQ